MVIMAKSKKKPAPVNYPVAIAKAHAQQAALTTQRTEAQADVAQAEREIETLKEASAAREVRLSQLTGAINEARSAVEKQETYYSLLGGSDLASLAQAREALRAAMDEYTALFTGHAQAVTGEQLQLANLQQRIAEKKDNIAILTTQIDNTGQARLALQQAYGESLYAEQEALLQEMEAQAHEAGKEAADANINLGRIQLEALRTLSPWPDLKRRFQGAHKLSEDPTTKVLSSFVAICDLLIAQGQEAAQAQAGLPAGAYSVLQEVDLSESLRALSNGNSIPLIVQSNRLDSLLQAYRRNLAL